MANDIVSENRQIEDRSDLIPLVWAAAGLCVGAAPWLPWQLSLLSVALAFALVVAGISLVECRLFGRRRLHRANAISFIVALMLVTAGVSVYFNYASLSKLERARRGVKKIETAVLSYQYKFGELPPDLEPLAPAGPFEGTKPPLWQSDLIDPWGQVYIYERGELQPLTGVPLIYSKGPPGRDAPIRNWNR